MPSQPSSQKRKQASERKKPVKCIQSLSGIFCISLKTTVQTIYRSKSKIYEISKKRETLKTISKKQVF